jgi:hypothetical protein
VLHDSAAEKSVVIVFFDNEDDYRKGDEVLNATPTGDTPGTRPTSSPGLATHAAAESAAATLPHGLGLADPAAYRALAHAPRRMLAWDRAALFDPSTRPRLDLSRV